jgi:hypothetical protein
MNLIWKAVRHMTLWGFLGGAGLGAAYGTALAPVYGTIYGALFGGIVGLPLGIIDGLVIGLVTYTYFYPLTDADQYRRTLTFISAPLTAVGAYVGFLWLLNTSFGFAVILVLPALIAGAAAHYASRRFARWYTENKREYEKPKRDEKPKRKREEMYA